MTGLSINIDRLSDRLAKLAEIGALDDGSGGVSRLAMGDEDKAARDLLVSWMRELGLTVWVDAIGNIFGQRPGTTDAPPITTGSHIDSVRRAGIYDGTLGVLAGLEVIERLDELNQQTKHPICVAAFSNEEGVRYTPDMMGSAVSQGHYPLGDALDAEGFDGTRLGDELERIGYAGENTGERFTPKAFVELHIEQGPILEADGIDIGAVEMVQGISWTEFTLNGQANHAGTTPMRLRRDAGLVAAEIIVAARAIAAELGGDQVATAGMIELRPNVINVVPDVATFTIDLRNTDSATLKQAERLLLARANTVAEAENVKLDHKSLARFEPVPFNQDIVSLVEKSAKGRGFSVKRMPSGAGHDAQMFAPNCPTAMIFVPSRDGISHNPREFTPPAEIEAGANILLDTILQIDEAG